MSSLMVLPDDTLMTIISMLPGDLCSGLSRGCHRWADIVHRHRVSKRRSRQREVHSDELHLLWDPVTQSFTDPLVKIDMIIMKHGWQESGLISLLQRFPHVGLMIRNHLLGHWAADMDALPHDTKTLVMSRIIDFGIISSSDMGSLRSAFFPRLTKVSVHKLMKDQIQLLLHSLPKLTDLTIVTGLKNMDLFATCKQQFSSFNLEMDQDNDGRPFLTFLRRKGSNLRHLHLTGSDYRSRDVRYMTEEDLISSLIADCRHLKTLNIVNFVFDFRLKYQSHCLKLKDFREVSLRPLMQLLPGIRSFEIMNCTMAVSPASQQAFLSWVQEMNLFAASKRKRMIRALVPRVPRKAMVESSRDSNLLLSVSYD